MFDNPAVLILTDNSPFKSGVPGPLSLLWARPLFINFDFLTNTLNQEYKCIVSSAVAF